MAKLYNFNMTKNGHNIDTACVRLRNLRYDAEEAGDFEAAERIQARLERIYDLAYWGSGCIQVTWEDWQFLNTVSEWTKHWRMCKCEEHGVEYVE